MFAWCLSNFLFLGAYISGIFLFYRAGKNSYKYSGLANLADTVGVTEVDGAVAISVSSKKKAGKFSTSLVKKNARRTIYAAGAVAKSKRPDLQVSRKERTFVCMGLDH